MTIILKWYWLLVLLKIRMNKRRGNIIGAVGALLVHLAVFVFLFLFFIRKPEKQEEGGVPVMLGNSELSQGLFDSATLIEVEALPENQTSPQEEALTEPTDQKVITQAEEPSIKILSQKKTAKKPEKEKVPKEIKEPKENTGEEQKKSLEKETAEIAGKRIAGAFGKGSKMSSSGSDSSGSGNEGSVTGNSSVGRMSGTGGYGTFDLSGRSIGQGGLPRPVYNVQDEGRVVVTITVNPAGVVISTAINKRTNTVNAALRKAAEDAARRAHFNEVEGIDNQTGTITYYFKLK